MAESILIVDDSPTQLEALRALLETNRYAVTAASTGEAALTALLKSPFDLVLSDVVMPGMSGFELCRRIKQEVPHPPAVVLLTSLADPREIVRGVECGADNYITKPYEPMQLLQRIRHVLHNTQLRGNTPADGPVLVTFQGEQYVINSTPQQIVDLLLSSFEELISTNNELQESKRQLARAHARELKSEQDARGMAEESARRMAMLAKNAEAATRARDDVLATVSHDLRNPVGTIFTSASLLLEMQLAPEAHTRQLEIIRRTAKRMDRLIQDLLDVSRMEAGAFSIHAQPENAGALFLEAQEQHGPAAHAKNIKLLHVLRDDDVILLVDRARMLQVLSNLVGNAIKFTPAGGTVTVRVDSQGSTAMVSVIDTGVGIKAENIPRVFDRFWYTGAAGGSGLGLAIAKGIVEAHGGHIWVESNEAGTAFHFTLPVETEQDGNRRKQPSALSAD